MDHELNAAARLRRSSGRRGSLNLKVSNVVEKGDGQFEEVTHADGKVRLKRAISMLKL